jgi:hypothetical protein
MNVYTIFVEAKLKPFGLYTATVCCQAASEASAIHQARQFACIETRAPASAVRVKRIICKEQSSMRKRS